MNRMLTMYFIAFIQTNLASTTVFVPYITKHLSFGSINHKRNECSEIDTIDKIFIFHLYVGSAW